MTLSTAIRKILSDKNMSLYDLSKKSGVSYSTVQRFITETKDIKSSNLMLIFDALNINFIELLGAEVSKQQKFDEVPVYLRKSISTILKESYNGI
jgi:DNA-binding Xre family transcriptional regulator